MIDPTERPHLQGERIALDVLDAAHVEQLVAAFDPATRAGIWRWYTTQITDAAALRRFLDGIVRAQAEGKTAAFAVRDRASGALIGSTRFLNIEVAAAAGDRGAGRSRPFR